MITIVLLAVKSFFSSLLKAVVSIFAGIIKFATENPKTFFSIVAAVLLSLILITVSYKQGVRSQEKVISALTARISILDAENAARLVKKTDIEALSKILSKQKEDNEVILNAKLEELTTDFKKSLAVETATATRVTIAGMAKANVFVKDSVVYCDRLSSSFFNSVNKISKETE